MSAIPISPATTPAWTRMLVACGLSFVLHISLLIGVPVKLAGDHPNPGPLIARLEPAAADDGGKAAAVLAEQAVPIPQEAPPPPVDATPPTPAPVAPQPQPQPQPQILPGGPRAAPGAGVTLPLNRDPTFYTTRELHVLPRPLPESEDHMKAEVARLDVRVRVLLLIDESGLVTDASIVDAQPAGSEDAVRALFLALRFSPGMIEGRAVKARVLMNARPVNVNAVR